MTQPASLSSRRVVALGLLLALVTARADDWPQFRGINRDAVWNETGIMPTFPKEGLNRKGSGVDS